VRRLEGLRLLVENDNMGAEFLETIR
jgi:hypothetical protein